MDVQNEKPFIGNFTFAIFLLAFATRAYGKLTLKMWTLGYFKI